MARFLYLAWKHGGADPYRLYWGLSEDYRPIVGGDPRPPRHPERVRHLIFGFAMQAEEEEVARVKAMAGSR